MTDIHLIMPKYDNNPSLPYGLYSLRTYLENKGVSVKITDCNIEKLRLKNEKFVGIYVTTFLFEEAKKIIQKSKAHGKYVICGGPHAWCDPESLLNLGADYVVVGDGEYATEHIIKNQPNEKIIKIPVNDINELPITRQEYKKYDYNNIHVMTSRGCPYACSFCTKHMPGFRQRNPEKIFEEWSMYDEKNLVVIDDLFTYNHATVEKVAELIKKEGLNLNISFSNGIRIDSVNKELLTILKDIGTIHISYGVESLNDTVLQLANKKITFSDIEKIVDVTQSSGIHFEFFMIIGLPGDTYENNIHAANWLKARDIKASWNLATPYPKTKFYNWVNSNGKWLIRPNDYSNYSGHFSRVNPIFETIDFSASQRIDAIMECNRICGYKNSLRKKIYSAMPRFIKPMVKTAWKMIS